MDDFERNNRNIADTKLWKLFVEKAKESELGEAFISAVGEVCAIGLNLSKYIVRFFPTFTLHDETHSANVCRWMWVLLGEQRAQLTAHEAALLLMAACCHDIGMAVSPEQEEQMRLRTYPGWDDYFRQNLKDDEEYEETKVISDRMLRNFVRMHHHERIGENLRESDWPDGVFEEELDRELLLELCRSHGTELEGAELTCRGELYDLRLCAVLLRLADLLDFDAGRTPEVLFRQMGLDRPKDAESWRSVQEHLKNRTGKFREKFVNGCIPYVAAYDNPGVEQENRKYLDWVDTELTNCRNCLSQSSRWKNLDLPYKVDDRKVKRKGYAAGKFCMTMNQDKVIDLLTGENLYSDAGVFVRELLQNSIDAVLMRAKQDTNFNLEDGLIQIDTWMDEEANTWFRIRDNGTGMNEHIIQNYFLKVGNSYYTSEEFQYANRHAPKGSYTAISRFGIGILSCFMGDKEHTQLKVSTKRFDEKGKSGIRLDVTGLHGYYFLCKEKKHPESELWFPKMPSLNEEDRGYRTESGTTICVNTNLLRMGELRSFQEILDKYVQFPEVRVTYNGPEGYKEYPTQQELMEAVYALNTDGVVKEYVHEIPNTEFEKLTALYPFHVWETKPAFSLRYEPLNWLAGSEKLTGVQITVLAEKPKVRLRDGINQEIREIFELANIKTKINNIDWSGIDLSITAPPASLLDDVHIFIPVEEVMHLETEACVWGLLAMHSELDRCNMVAYNGILVESKRDRWRKVFTIMLLREDFGPQVSLARNRITSFPLEAACCLAMGDMNLDIVYGMIALVTQREIQGVLDRYPQWQKELSKAQSCIWGDGYSAKSELRVALWMTYWKQRCRVLFKEGKLFAEMNQSPDDSTMDFPATMFIWGNGSRLCISYGHSCIYDCNHPFSLWLIRNQAALMKEMPDIYNTIVETMKYSTYEDQIIETINGILTKLKNYRRNTFLVPDNLVLTEADFIGANN